jgi:hypothetical protein
LAVSTTVNGGIEIYCRESSHENQRWLVGTFIDTGKPASAGERWALHSDGLKGGARVQQLRGEQLKVRLPPQYVNRIRDRYRLRCDLCGRTVIRNVAPMQAILTGLHEHGVTEISLLGLAAISALPSE